MFAIIIYKLEPIPVRTSLKNIGCWAVYLLEPWVLMSCKIKNVFWVKLHCKAKYYPYFWEVMCLQPYWS